MDRRRFIRNSVLGVATASSNLLLGCKGSSAAHAGVGHETVRTYDERGQGLFPLEVPGKTWAQFPADGFSEIACGVVYRREDEVPHGMPLGGVATGFLDVDTDGTFGYCNLFNSGVPTRGPLQYGFLGLNTDGRTWILSTREVTGLENAKDIHYWGHYPIADLEYETDAPLSVGLRAWSPFIPGDIRASNTPGAVFEVHVRNLSSNRRKATIGFSFPGPTQAEAQISASSPRELRYIDWFPVSDPVAHGTIPAKRERVGRGLFSGISVTAATGTGYALGVIGSEAIRFGSGLWTEGYDFGTGQQWRAIANRLPKVAADNFDSSLAVDFELSPQETKVIRILLAWYSPVWRGDKSNIYTRMYTRHYQNAGDVAESIAENHDALCNRIISWQQAVYTDSNLPVWLRESLVNILHLMTKTGYWAVAREPIGKWCREEDGLFGMSECPRECPQIECIPCSFYGNVPVVYFFPDLAKSTLQGYKAYQYSDGAPPWVFGGCTAGAADGYHATDPCDMATPSPGYQNTLNGPCYVDMFDRYWQTTGDDEILREFYPSLKRAVVYTMNLRPGPEGIISVPAGDRNPTQAHAKPGAGLDWFEGNGWFGMTPHVGGIHLAMIRMAERMAEKMGDTEFVSRCRQWIKTGGELMESKLWAGKYYLAYYEPETSKKSDLVFGYQLDGDWMCFYHGVPRVFRLDRAKITLDTIRHTCMAIAPYGAANFANPDGTVAASEKFMAQGWGLDYGSYGYFPPEVWMLAATYLYYGEHDTGMKLAESCLHGIVKYGYTWTQPNIVNGSTGKRVYGSDYYQNMLLWSLPAAIEQKDLRHATAPGSLVDRVIRAGRSGSRVT
jgi:uncharacterized protein (DUF608 family)